VRTRTPLTTTTTPRPRAGPPPALPLWQLVRELVQGPARGSAMGPTLPLGTHKARVVVAVPAHILIRFHPPYSSRSMSVFARGPATQGLKRMTTKYVVTRWYRWVLDGNPSLRPPA
jgi:hypothetical protein